MLQLSVSRRQFIQASTVVGMTTLLGGCGRGTGIGEIKFLRKSIPPQLIRIFKDQYPQFSSLQFNAGTTLKTLFSQLENWQSPPAPTLQQGLIRRIPFVNREPTKADLMTLGDRWLSAAIKKNIIQPVDPSTLAHWNQLPPRWQKLVQRDKEGLPSLSGSVWAIPYRWGTTMIVYRKSVFKKLGWQPQEWADLWRPEIKQQLALMDCPRDIIGLALKKMGLSANLSHPKSEAALLDTLMELNRQVKFYSNDHYLQALLNKDVSLAVGWSNEILPLLKTQTDLAACLPPSGTILWADCWVIPPSSSDLNEAAIAWLDFFGTVESVKPMALFANGAPVMYNATHHQALPQKFIDNPLINVSPNTLNKSEFVETLPPESEEEYDQLWQMMRRSTGA